MLVTLPIRYAPKYLKTMTELSPELILSIVALIAAIVYTTVQFPAMFSERGTTLARKKFGLGLLACLVFFVLASLLA